MQATLQVVNPGVGLFPPNSNNNSGDSIMASISRGACPAGVLMSGLGVSGSGNKSVLSALSAAGQRGTGAAFAANGGSANYGPAGGDSFGAGGLNQTNAPGAGEITTLPANAPSSIPVIPSPNNFRG